MEVVQVVCCAACHLRWLQDGRFDRCPNCRRFRTIAAGEVRLKTVEGELEGPEPILAMSPYAGESCVHGVLSPEICLQCNS